MDVFILLLGKDALPLDDLFCFRRYWPQWTMAQLCQVFGASRKKKYIYFSSVSEKFRETNSWVSVFIRPKHSTRNAPNIDKLCSVIQDLIRSFLAKIAWKGWATAGRVWFVYARFTFSFPFFFFLTKDFLLICVTVFEIWFNKTVMKQGKFPQYFGSRRFHEYVPR